MKKYIVYIVSFSLLHSCSTKKRILTTGSLDKNGVFTTNTKINTIKNKKPLTKDVSSVTGSSVNNNQLANSIVNKALSFKGTRYKYGGTTKSGVDCSGLMYASFKSGNIDLPRTSRSQSTKGIAISKNNAVKGDLVFFKTGRSKQVNHVGLVVSVDSREIKFVHSSSSRGVMISSLREGYWSNAFSHIRRVISNDNLITRNKNNRSSNYIVKKGDTLYAISRKYNGVSVSSIMRLNNLKTTSLKPGMKLLIPK